MTATSPEKKPSVLTKFVHPFIVIRDAIKRKFVLRRRKTKAGEADPRVAKKSRAPPTDGSVPLTSQEKRIRMCNGSQNVWHECEDRLCNKYWLNDSTGEKVNKKPKAATIIQLMVPKNEDDFEKRVLYFRTRPSMDYATQARQLLVLSENESIQRMRAEAANIGAKQLEHAEINTRLDLLEVCGLGHWEEQFEREGITLSTAFFLKDSDMSEIGMVLGERIRLTQVLECMRKIEVKKIGEDTVLARNTKFIKGDIVEHLKESENLIRKGKVVGVHSDDIAAGVYYTVALENEGGYEVQSAERKLEFPGVWEKILRDKGIEPIFKEPGGDDDNNENSNAVEQPLPEEHTHQEEMEPNAETVESQAVSTGVDAEEEVAAVEDTEALEEVHVDESVAAVAELEQMTEITEADGVDGEQEEAARPESGLSHGTSAVSEEEEDEAEGYTGRAPPPLPPASTEEVATEVTTEEQPIQAEEQPEETQFASGHEEYPMYVGMSRYSGNNYESAPQAEEDSDDRKQSILSLAPTVEMEELVEDETSGMGVPPPPAPSRDEESGMGSPPPPPPGQHVHRGSNVSRRDSNASHRESLYSIEPTMELIEMDEIETSGMVAPPPPIPHRASTASELPMEEMLEVRSMQLDEDDDDVTVTGLPPPPPIPSARKDSLSARKDSIHRRVSFGSHASYSPKQNLSPHRSSPVNENNSSIRMEEELSAMGELEMLDMHEEIIDFDDDETKE